MWASSSCPHECPYGDVREWKEPPGAPAAQNMRQRGTAALGLLHSVRGTHETGTQLIQSRDLFPKHAHLHTNVCNVNMSNDFLKCISTNYFTRCIKYRTVTIHSFSHVEARMSFELLGYQIFSNFTNDLHIFVLLKLLQIDLWPIYFLRMDFQAIYTNWYSTIPSSIQTFFREWKICNF